MPPIAVERPDDPRIEPYRRLKGSNRARDLGLFVVEGEKLLDRLIASRFPVASALATEKRATRIAEKLPPGVPLYVAPEATVSLLVGYNFHQGVLACGVRRAWPDLAEILGSAGPAATLVVCPALHNPENLGTIARTADVFGVPALLVGASCPDPLSRRVLRVSMGSTLRLPVLSRSDEGLSADLDRLLREFGVVLAAAVTDADAEPVDAYAARRPDRLALLLGSEGAGLPTGWVARCDDRVTIPMRAGADSLNVSVAAGILLHHLARP